MIHILSLAVFISLTSFIGFNVILLFDRKNILNLFEALGLSYLLGIGLISLELSLLWFFNILLPGAYIILVWAPILIINIPRYKLYIKNLISKISFKFNFNNFEKMFVSLLFFEIIYTFFRALMKPVESYDSVAIWSLKAKIIYLSKIFPADFFPMVNSTFHGAHADYPLLLPFSQVWFYTFFNSFNDYLVKIIFPLNFLAFLLIFYSLLKKETGKRATALLFTFIIASIKQFNDYATVAVPDLPLGIYSCFLFV